MKKRISGQRLNAANATEIEQIAMRMFPDKPNLVVAYSRYHQKIIVQGLDPEEEALLRHEVEF